MSQCIHILPEELCNKIAAGEVVERPASVVKELVENSLDAQADEIRIEIEQGGRKLIRVHDDGQGMSRDDAFLCLERHATSKIRNDADMFALDTLGFRGEALPSIASVSRFTLRTCLKGETVGTEIQVEGGIVRQAQDAGFPVGTQVEVRNLFFNTPARRKFLRREETEIGHIADIVTKQALAHPQVRFLLKHNGRVLVDARREKGLVDRTGLLLGRTLAEELLPLEMSSGDGLHCRGLIAPATTTRSTTGAIYTYINGRYVRDKVVQHAVLEGYRGLLMRGRYPVVVLFLEMDPGEVDVNVHPTKHEVRFRQQRQVHDFISNAIREQLRKDYRPEHQPNTSSEGGRESVLPVQDGSLEQNRKPAPPEVMSSQADVNARPTDQRNTAEHVQEPLQPFGSQVAQPGKVPAVSSLQEGPESFFSTESATKDTENRFFRNLRYIGQYQGTYLLAEYGQELVLVDQHAAHERVTFERLKRQYFKGRVEAQRLMFPVVVELDFQAASALETVLVDLERLGFELEAFGGRSYNLKAIPQLLGEGAPEKLLQDVAAEVLRYGDSAQIEEQMENVLAGMACHSSVRAHQILTETEVLALFEALDQIDFNAHCPHGRPVVKRFSLYEVERMFRRT